MKEEAIIEKIGTELKKDLKSGVNSLWWLSFCDGETGKFKGVIIIEAMGFTHAVYKTHNLKINPGGEIQAIEIPKEYQRHYIHHTNKLLSKEYLEKHKLN